MRVVKAWIARVLLALVSLGFTGLALECGVRRLAPREAIAPFPAIYRGSENAGIGYELLPDYTGYAYGTALVTNSQGLRDDPVVLPKPKDVHRTLVLGDSVTYGYGVLGMDTFPQQLEELLAAHCTGLRFDVVNAGVVGYNTAQEVAWLWEHGLALDPDLVVLTFVRNDVLTPFEVDDKGYLHQGPAKLLNTRLRAKPLPIPFGAWLRDHSWLFRLIEARTIRLQLTETRDATSNRAIGAGRSDAFNRGLTPQAMMRSYFETYSHAARPRWASIEKEIVGMHSKLRERQVDFMLVTFNMPGLFLQRILALRDRTRVPFLDFGYHFGSGPRWAERWSLGWDGHPNELAHTWMAWLLFEQLVADGLLPGSCERPEPLLGQTFENSYREDAARFAQTLETTLAQGIESSEIDFDTPTTLQLLRGGRRLFEHESTIVLLRQPEAGASQLELSIWLNPETFTGPVLPIALNLELNGRALPPRDVSKLGFSRHRWLVSRALAAEERLEVRIAFRTRVAPDADAPRILRLTRIALIEP